MPNFYRGISKNGVKQHFFLIEFFLRLEKTRIVVRLAAVFPQGLTLILIGVRSPLI